MEQVAPMKHASTRTVHAYWEEKRGTRLAPERADIDPIAIRHALGDTFMLAADFVDQLRFRLAGTRVCALFCREIKGEEFSGIWSEQSRKPVADLMTVVTGEAIGAVAGLTGHAADGATIDLELLLLPLAHIGHARIRALGVLAPIAPSYWIGVKPIAELTLGTLRHLGPEIEQVPAPLQPEVEGRTVRHGFTVYSGGRGTSSSERTG
jgi:hypothetical protein